jgi:KDO2-lipid IV(A) lauroyltransferase
MSVRGDAHSDASGRATFTAAVLDRAVLGLLAVATRAAERLSIDRAVALGAGFGRLWLRLHGPRVRRVRLQLVRAFPECDVAVREAWAQEVFVHLGRGMAELLLLRGRHRAALLERVAVDGREHLEAAERASPTGGVMIVTAHYGNWELAGARVAALGVPISVVYRGRNRVALDQALLDLRTAGAPPPPGAPTAVEQIPTGPTAGRKAIRALDAGRKLLVLLDQNARRRDGVFVSFFSQPACTRSAPLDIAARSGVPVLPAFIRRDPDGRGHRIRIHPALQLEPGAFDDEEVLRRNVQRATAAIEQEIRAAPGQWLWTHRRWRTQPPDGADPSG